MSDRETPSNLFRAGLRQQVKERKRSRSRSREPQENNSALPQTSSQTDTRYPDKVFPDHAKLTKDNQNDYDPVEIRNILEGKMPIQSNFEGRQSEEHKAVADIPAEQFWRWDGDITETKAEEKKEHSVLYFAKVEATHESDMLDTSSVGWSYPCTRFSRYRVTPELMDGDGPFQTAFIQKIFTVLFVKALIVVFWLLLLEFFDDFRHHYSKHSGYGYHYISGVIYIALKLVIRMARNFRKRYCYICILLQFLEIIVACDFIACVVPSWFDNHFNVSKRILYCIIGTYLFFIVVGAFVEYDMNDSVMTGSAFFVTAIIAVRQLIHSKSSMGMVIVRFNAVNGLGEILSALNVLVISELVITVVMFELRSVLAGNRFSVSENDWFFTAIYLI